MKFGFEREFFVFKAGEPVDAGNLPHDAGEKRSSYKGKYFRQF
jgi:hypothetical protein